MTSFENFFNMWEPVQTQDGFKRPELVGDFSNMREAQSADLDLFQRLKQKQQESGAERSSRDPFASLRDPLFGIRVTDQADLDLVVRDYGVGGMCFVVWGPNRTTGGWCAAKVPHEALVASNQSGNNLQAHFEQEALHWCELWPHPFIVVPAGLTRIPRWHNLPALVLEYCPGGSLAEKLTQAHRSRQPLSLCEAFRWAQQVALGLNAMHHPAMHHPWSDKQKPLIHCDLKPGNIVIDAHDTARITDLGLARAWVAVPPDAPQNQARETRATILETFSTGSRLDLNRDALSIAVQKLAEAPEVSSAGTAVGTPPYMPLEQWRGLDEVTTASDIYALGIVIFEIFAGRSGTPHNPQPRSANTVLAWYRAHQNGPRRTLASTYSDPVAACGPLSAMLAHRGTGPRAATEGVRAQSVLRELDQLVLACLHETPANRPTAQQVAETLASLAEQLECERVQAPPVFPRIPGNVAMYYHRLATIYGQLGDRGKQRELMQRAVELNPTDAGLEYGLGKAMAELGQFEEAIRHFNQAENLINAQQIAWATSITYMLPFSKGNAYLNLGRYNDALASYETSLGLSPENAGTLFNIALAYFKWAPHAIHDIAVYRARLEQGLRRVNEALRHEPAFPRARTLRDELADALSQISGQ